MYCYHGHLFALCDNAIVLSWDFELQLPQFLSILLPVVFQEIVVDFAQRLDPEYLPHLTRYNLLVHLGGFDTLILEEIISREALSYAVTPLVSYV